MNNRKPKESNTRFIVLCVIFAGLLIYAIPQWIQNSKPVKQQASITASGKMSPAMRHREMMMRRMHGNPQQ